MAGFTPMTLTGRRPALISAPSNAIVFLTPVILFSALRSWLVIPGGATTSRSGRMICRNEPAIRVAARAGVGTAEVNDSPSGWLDRAGQHAGREQHERAAARDTAERAR